MVALAIVRRDLLRFARSPVRTALLLAVPLVLAGVFTLVFGGGGPSDIVLRVLVHNQDQGLLSRLLNGIGSRQPEEGVTLEVVQVGEEGYRMIDEGEASALIVIPAGFTAAVLEGRPVTLEVVKNPSERFLPGVVEEGVGVVASVLSQGARVLRPELDRIAAMGRAGKEPSLEEVTALTEVVYRRVGEVERYLLPPVIELDSGTVGGPEGTAEDGPSILAYFLPGLSVMGVFFFAQAVTRDIQRDREAGLLRHMLTAPVSVGDYLVGKCLSVIVSCLLGFGLLLGVGLAVGVGWGPPLALAVVVTSTSIAIAGTMLLISSLARTERQADAVGTIVIIVWSMLGGVFLPLAAMPSFVRPLSASTLTYWSVEGLTRLVIEGAGLAEVVGNVTVLLAAGTVLLAIAVVVLRRRITAGAV